MANETVFNGDVVVLNNDYSQLYVYLGGNEYLQIQKPTEVIEETEEYIIKKHYKVHKVFLTETPKIKRLASAYYQKDEEDY